MTCALIADRLQQEVNITVANKLVHMGWQFDGELHGDTGPEYYSLGFGGIISGTSRLSS
jgi:hypothetical protein